MRLVLILFLLSFSFRSFGMAMGQCPRVLRVSVSDLRLPESSSGKSAFPQIGIYLSLKFAGAGKCHYEGRNRDGSFFWANLGDATGELTSAPYLLKIRSNSLALYIGIEELGLMGIQAEDMPVEIYSRNADKEETHLGVGSLVSTRL